MLGKGLESLIPPQNQSNNSPNNNSDLNQNSEQNLTQNQFNNQQTNLNTQTNQNQSSNSCSNIQNKNLLENKEEKFLENHQEKLLQEHKPELIKEEHEELLLKTNSKIELESPKEKKLINNQSYENYQLNRNKNIKADSVFYIEVSKIRPNPHQPRKDFNEESINELAESIRQFGIIQPLVVRKIEKDVPTGTEVEYEIIAGERRWLASKKLGLETVPAIIRNISAQQEGLELAIIENIQRENLNPIETARAFARLQDEFRLTQREIASRLGKSREAVANALRLLDLPQDIQNAISEGKISESHGRLLLTIEDKALQQKLFEDLLKSNLTTRELKYKINAIKLNKENNFSNKIQIIDPEIKILEEKLKLTFGTPVKISKEGKNGKIIIEFYSEEELKNIVSKITSENTED
ncbi:MAG: ParB/RepB/Spo0J family partition protein [Patescibacteria group bacterium]|nr:ParB/RepB/Spo0J family partition protein [Patescibacteria group bacterium]MDW8279730.1 ParB/RepB/Spo0J family partition protein [bacterium]